MPRHVPFLPTVSCLLSTSALSFFSTPRVGEIHSVGLCCNPKRMTPYVWAITAAIGALLTSGVSAQNDTQSCLADAVERSISCWRASAPEDVAWLLGDEYLGLDDALRDADWSSLVGVNATEGGVRQFFDGLLEDSGGAGALFIAVALLADDAVYGYDPEETRAKICRLVVFNKQTYYRTATYFKSI